MNVYLNNFRSDIIQMHYNQTKDIHNADSKKKINVNQQQYLSMMNNVICFFTHETQPIYVQEKQNRKLHLLGSD